MEKFLTKDTEIRNLNTREELQEYLDFRDANDIWVEPYIEECALVGLENNPLAIMELKGRSDLVIDSSVDDLEACSNDMGWLLNFPLGTKYVVYPVLYTGIESVCQRAGIAGRTIRNTEEKKYAKVMSPVRKAAIISEMFGLYSNRCKILIRDGKIPYMGSNLYLPLSAKKGIETLEKELKEEYPDLLYVSGMVSNEYLYTEFNLNDETLEANVRASLEDAGKRCSTVSAGVRFITSDVGTSMMRVSAYITIDGVKAVLGKPIGIRHDISKATKEKKTSDYEYTSVITEEGIVKTQETVEAEEVEMTRFSEEVRKIGAVFKECEDQVESLGNTIVNNPAGCFQHIVLSNKLLPMGTAKEIAKEIELAYPGCASAIDIFFALNDLVERSNQKKVMTPTQYINMTESVAETLFYDYTAYDLPLEEWKRA